VHSVGDSRGVEEVELVMPWHRNLMARVFREWS
jgi:hypothetical protein